MRNFVTAAFLAVLLLAPSAAAPVPKDMPTELEKLFGKPDDPTKLCGYKLDGTKLVITVPGKVEADSSVLTGAPRTRRQVTGDFEVEVGVSCYLSDGSSDGHAGVGLAIWSEETTFVMASRLHSPSLEKFTCTLSGRLDTPRDGSFASNGCDLLPSQASRVKLRREKGVVTVSLSMDNGEVWITLQSREFELPETVNVGVVAFNSLKAKLEVTCESLTVTPLGKK